MGDRFIVVRVPEADQRTLLYAPDGERSITVTHEQEVASLDPKDLQAINLWDEATALAADLQRAYTARKDGQQCGAWYGNREDGGYHCLRVIGHPPMSADGVGHSDSARYQGL